MLRACKYCGKIHDSKVVCASKPTYIPKKPTVATQVHNSNKWKRISHFVRGRDAYLCVYCLSQNKVNLNDIEVHHIEPIESNYEKAYDVFNLISLCRRHHEEAESGKISKDELLKLVEKQNKGLTMAF